MNALRILMVSAELAPIAKTGGLADMVAGLAGQLVRDGHDVRVILPAYGGAPPAWHELAAGHAPSTGDAYRLLHRPAAPGAPPVYLIDAPVRYGGSRVYRGDDGDAARFALLAEAALHLYQALAWRPDVIHCHDWHAALLPYLLHIREAHGPPVLLTIHNIGYQGDFPAHLAGRIGLPPAVTGDAASPADNPRLNFLRIGITHADALTTVSPTHAREILTPAHGHGLDGLLRQRADRLRGILNGADYTLWNPARDPCIAARYDDRDTRPKARCKADLIELAGLGDNGGRPLLGMVTRLAWQKGIELVCAALPPLLAAGRVQALILGEGEPRYGEHLAALAATFPRDFAFIEAQDETLAHKVYAGADALLVPSIYEPCGLTQMYALRYGTVPIVRATGGLQDTVSHYMPERGEGTGSVFRDADVNGLAWAIGEVLGWYETPPAWHRLVANGLRADFSWVHQARAYEAVYRELCTAAENGGSGLSA